MEQILAQPLPKARRRLTTGARLAVTALAVVASITMIAPTSAFAANDRFEIANAGNNSLRADVMWASAAPFQGIFLWPDNSSTSQEFEKIDSGGGYFRIKARHSGQCLMFDWRAGNNNGTPIIQYPACDGGYAPAEWYTQWISRDNGCTSPCFGSVYQLVRNRFSGRCLDARNPAGGVPGQQAVLQQWDCITSGNQWNAWNQMWQLTYATSSPPVGPR